MKKLLFLVFLLWHSNLFAGTINSDNLKKFIGFCDQSKADEILLSVEGRIISHWKRSDYTQLQIDSGASKCGTPYMGTASMVKSWTGILIGILVDKKYIKSVDDEVCNYIPEWEIACRNKITVRHLLTMTAGYTRMGARGILSQSDMHSYALQLKPDTLPDRRFAYSNESVQLLGILAERVTKLKGEQLFQKFILKPMGMDSTTFAKDSVGNIIFYGGCTTTVRNAWKMGQLMLNKGKWKGKRIVSESWITASASPGKLAPYYGYLWWIDRNSKYWNFAATGDLGQMTIVFPELNLVFVRKQSCDLSSASKNMAWMGPKFLELLYSVVEK